MIKIQDTTAKPDITAEVILTPGEVARLYGVDPKTVTRWAKTGKIPQGSWFWTPGGARRYRGNAIVALINGSNGSSNGAVK